MPPVAIMTLRFSAELCSDPFSDFVLSAVVFSASAALAEVLLSVHFHTFSIHNLMKMRKSQN